MFFGLLALAALVLFVLAGLRMEGRHFAPGWFAVGCAAAVLLSPYLARLA